MFKPLKINGWYHIETSHLDIMVEIDWVVSVTVGSLETNRLRRL